MGEERRTNDLYRGDSISDGIHIRLFTVQTQRIDAGWHTQDVQSSYWRLYFNDADGAALELETGLFPLAADRLYLVPAGVRFNCHNVQAITHFYIHFDVVGLPYRLLKELFGAPVDVPQTATLQETLRSSASGSAFHEPTRIASLCAAKALVYQSLAACLSGLPAEQRARYDRITADCAPVLAALDRIERRYAEPLLNRDLAADCCLSENYFIRRFRECVGHSPGHYLLEQRIRMAAQRLIFTTETVEEIAQRTGFGSRAYFTRMFARQTGVAPAAYRKASRV